METGEASSETLRNAKRVWRFVQSDGYPDKKVTMNRNALTVDEHYTSLPPNGGRTQVVAQIQS